MRKFLPLTVFLFSISLETKADCNPAFTATVQQATVQLQAANTAPHLFHSWRLAAGVWVSGQTVSWTYSTQGAYTIMHKVVDSLNNCEDSAQQTITVNFQISCTALFSSQRDTLLGNYYTFQSTSVCNGGTISHYIWTRDGNTVANTSSFGITLAPGPHDICLSIYTTAGCSSSICFPVNVYSDSCSWSASFAATAPAFNPREMHFTPTPSSDRMRFSWNFGDGYYSSQKMPVHIYLQSGTFTVRLEIYDTLTGCYDAISQQLRVDQLPSDSCTVSFTWSADSVLPNRIHFTAISNQTITSQTWRLYHWVNPFYDTIVINASNPTYTFSETGYYYTCLFITTSTGCSNWTCWGLYIDSIGGRQAGRIPSYPNPARTTVGFRLPLAEESRISITVYDLSGNVVYRTQKNGNRGMNEISVPVQQLNAGQYFVDIRYGNQQKRSIFQKL